MLNSHYRLEQRKTSLACMHMVSRTLASQGSTYGHALESIWAGEDVPGWASRAATQAKPTRCG